MTKCLKCRKEGIIHFDYSGADLCQGHFCQFVEKRVQREVKSQGKMPKGSTLAVAVSGGKDSMSMLYILHKIFGEHRGVRLVALTVDEGISGYKKGALKIVAGFCKANDIRLEKYSFKKEFGIEMDKVAGLGKGHRPCAYCGVLRRSLLNRKARELGASRIALGHNLDDMAQSILMNMANADVNRLVRLGPHVQVQEGLVPRMLPLRTIPEEETKLYASIREIPFLDAHCPYRPRAHRLGFHGMIKDLEKGTPGTRHAILSSYDQIIIALRKYYQPVKLQRCKKCGEPAMESTCKACEMLEKLRGAGPGKR
jgi:uncharacterized protein (TIGR00269 family)